VNHEAISEADKLTMISSSCCKTHLPRQHIVMNVRRFEGIILNHGSSTSDKLGGNFEL
jgi:hypothetical protein